MVEAAVHKGIKSYDVARASWLNNINNNSNFNANNRNVDNHNRVRGIARHAESSHRYDLWQKLCSYQNIELAFKKARKHKTLRPCVIEFEKELSANLCLLRTELLLHSYSPRPLETFILRDPKTRKISKSDQRNQQSGVWCSYQSSQRNQRASPRDEPASGKKLSFD